jgi:hypothetical protein
VPRLYENLETKLNQVIQKLKVQLPKDRHLSMPDIVNILVSNGNLTGEAKQEFDTIMKIKDKRPDR